MTFIKAILLASAIIIGQQGQGQQGKTSLESELEKIAAIYSSCSYGNYESCIKAFSMLQKLRNDGDSYGVRAIRKNKRALEKSLSEIINRIDEEIAERGYEFDSKLFFPLKNVKLSDIGLGGFVARNYDWLEGSFYKGHPAYDIFVYDRNRDSLDDRTKKPIKIFAAADGIIVSVFDEWEKSGKGNGGNYIYLYNSKLKYFFYYAHLGKIFVKEGDFVRGGDVIAYLGRTGRAAERPTHLHFAIYYFDKAKQNLVPVDWIKERLFDLHL
ncbi:MAG: M23 family metallopeptidase [Candidatus Pacearchaeota archaeon]